MKKRKVILATVIILFGYWFLSSAKEIYVLMNKYPKEFKQEGDFSFYRFYNTYRTLSFSEVMIKRGYVHRDYCFYSSFKDREEEVRLLPLVKEEYLKAMKAGPDSELANKVDSFKPAGPNCRKNSKLINFEFKCKEAYATYACESGDYVNEFTYTANAGEKCYLIDYKKSWGVEPKRTIDDTKKFILLGVSDSIFDSPECQPTNR